MRASAQAESEGSNGRTVSLGIVRLCRCAPPHTVLLTEGAAQNGPQCWWRQNEHVEALSALWDHERSSFSGTSPATAPLEWLRPLRDVGALLRAWTAESGCGASHREPPARLRALDEDGWERHVAADVARRRVGEAGEDGAGPQHLSS